MKNISNIENEDIFSSVTNSDDYKRYYREEEVKTRIGVEVFNKRKKLALKQSDLAQKIVTSQKIISKIENGSLNIGIGMLERLSTALEFNSDTFANIFNCPKVIKTKRIVVGFPVKSSVHLIEKWESQNGSKVWNSANVSRQSQDILNYSK